MEYSPLLPAAAFNCRDTLSFWYCTLRNALKSFAIPPDVFSDSGMFFVECLTPRPADKFVDRGTVIVPSVEMSANFSCASALTVAACKQNHPGLQTRPVLGPHYLQIKPPSGPH
jgi:hypothetical protein